MPTGKQAPGIGSRSSNRIGEAAQWGESGTDLREGDTSVGICKIVWKEEPSCPIQAKTICYIGPEYKT